MKKGSKFFKAFRYLCLSFVVVAGFVAIIGTGGGGGGGGGSDGSTSLATGEFTKTAQLDSNNGYLAHFRNIGTGARIQHLYLADGVNGSGYITAIAFKSNATTVAEITCPDLTLKMGHTSLSALTNTFADNVEEGMGSLETVLTNAQVVVPLVSSGDYFEIQLDTPFYYNGVDNLVVEFIRTGVCDDDLLLRCDTTFSNGSLWSFDLASATGTLDVGLNMEFLFEGGANSVEFAASAGVGNSFPFGNSYNKVQLLYDATVINGSGPITGIAMRTGTSAVTTEESYTYTMRVGHSTLTDLDADFNGNFSDTPATVADNEVFKVPAGVPTGNYIWIPMPEGSFNYNGSDNLIVEIDVSASSGTTLWSSITTPNQTRASGDSGSASANGGVDTAQYDIRFRFNGGTMDKLTLASFNTAPPFSASSYSGRQYLYTASELGTKATITKVALRLSSAPSTAADYSNFTITMGHTSLTELTVVFANNMDDATQVYNGTFGMPAGLIVGDWIEMALDSPFIYNGTGNLVVSFESDGGSTAQYVIIGTGTLYPNRALRLPADTLQDSLADIRLWVQ